MSDQLTIPARYNGPPDSGNGGYSCGALAAFIDGAARVRLSSPPPLDKALAVKHIEEGLIELRDGEQVVATAKAEALDMHIPAAPSVQQAELASKAYAGFKDHSLPTCYVCGPDRPSCDGMHLYTGAVDQSELYACVWLPKQDQLDEQGNARPEIVWAALDCPGYFAGFKDELKPALLGELTANITHDVVGAKEHVVFAWPIEHSGRKHIVGTAIADVDGKVLAYARATWIQLKV